MERMTSKNKFKGIYKFKKIILNFKFRIHNIGETSNEFWWIKE
jgi:hypothetical protein